MKLIKTWVRALRVYQWVKNTLIFVPLLTSFHFTQLHDVLQTIAAFFAFSMVASANYLVNDLMDIESDRLHPRKRLRPLASGAIGKGAALSVAALFLIVGAALAWVVGGLFPWVLAGYLALTLTYSAYLKKLVLADVLTLSMLYTVRIMAGAVAISVELTSWLLAFSVFIFFSLALIKRCAELVAMEEEGVGRAAGRNYLAADLRVLWPLGVGAALCAVVIFGLYISADETRMRYASPNVIWLAGLGLIYWLSRLWIKTSRGEMHDDPIVYALRDRASRLCIASMIVATLCAYFIRLPL